MRITDNFTLQEMTNTNTGLSNEPNTEQLENIIKLAKLLQIIRNEYGKPIKVNSAFRSVEVNNKVKGSKNSDHLYGCAADITCERNDVLWEIINHLIVTKQISVRQLIWEYGTQYGPKWIHISINNKYNKEKHNEILYIGVGKVKK